MNHFAIHCDPGPRDSMEDAALAFSVPCCTGAADATHVLLVLDGAGGESAGEVASGEGKRRLGSLLLAELATGAAGTDCTPLCARQAEVVIRTLLEQTNQAICQRAMRDAALSGMATTVVCSLVIGDALVTGWAGDSKCYIYSGAEIRPVTRDHSRVQALVDRGELRRSEALFHPEAHVITRYLGQSAGFKPDTIVTPLRPGDLVIQCSDGLTDVLSEEDIARILGRCEARGIDIHQVAQQLVGQALGAGTQDNTTVLCYRHGFEAHDPIWNRTCTAGYSAAVARSLPFVNKEKFSW